MTEKQIKRLNANRKTSSCGPANFSELLRTPVGSNNPVNVAVKMLLWLILGFIIIIFTFSPLGLVFWPLFFLCCLLKWIFGCTHNHYSCGK